MLELINKLDTSVDNKKSLELFLINCSLDNKSKVDLLKIIENISEK